MPEGIYKQNVAQQTGAIVICGKDEEIKTKRETISYLFCGIYLVSAAARFRFRVDFWSLCQNLDNK